MIPYIAQPVVRLGPIAIHLFGVLVATAVLVGSGLARRRARTAGLPTDATAFLARRRYAGMRWIAFDAIAYGFPFGWIFGRLGCFVAFDHPGLATHFVLGERYVDGVVRHNLGLEEALFIAVVAGLFLVLGRKARPAGFFVGLLAVLYTPVRFGLDALRIDDARYFGLTPAQYGAVGLLLVGLGVMTAAFRRGAGSAVVDRWSVSL